MRIQQIQGRLLREARLSCPLKLVLQSALLLHKDFLCYNFAEASMLHLSNLLFSGVRRFVYNTSILECKDRSISSAPASCYLSERQAKLDLQQQ